MKMNFKIDNPPRWKVQLVKWVFPFSKGDIITAYMKKPLDGLWFEHFQNGKLVEKNLKLTDFIIVERVR